MAAKKKKNREPDNTQTFLLLYYPPQMEVNICVGSRFLCNSSQLSLYHQTCLVNEKFIRSSSRQALLNWPKHLRHRLIFISKSSSKFRRTTYFFVDCRWSLSLFRLDHCSVFRYSLLLEEFLLTELLSPTNIRKSQHLFYSVLVARYTRAKLCSYPHRCKEQR